MSMESTENFMPPSDDVMVTGEDWILCQCGRHHWGLFGAAGVLLIRTSDGGEKQVLLQHRALFLDQGGTWGIPGGAFTNEETPESGALREMQEEVGFDPADVAIQHTFVSDHGTWSYTTVIGVYTGSDEIVIDDESLEVTWVDFKNVTRLPLHPGFASAWRDLIKIASAM
jgi:8-oxo-dGTP diphosphatase